MSLVHFGQCSRSQTTGRIPRSLFGRQPVLQIRGFRYGRQTQRVSPKSKRGAHHVTVMGPQGESLNGFTCPVSAQSQSHACALLPQRAASRPRPYNSLHVLPRWMSGVRHLQHSLHNQLHDSIPVKVIHCFIGSTFKVTCTSSRGQPKA